MDSFDSFVRDLFSDTHDVKVSTVGVHHIRFNFRMTKL